MGLRASAITSSTSGGVRRRLNFTTQFRGAALPRSLLPLGPLTRKMSGVRVPLRPPVYQVLLVRFIRIRACYEALWGFIGLPGPDLLRSRSKQRAEANRAATSGAHSSSPCPWPVNRFGGAVSGTLAAYPSGSRRSMPLRCSRAEMGLIECCWSAGNAMGRWRSLRRRHTRPRHPRRRTRGVDLAGGKSGNRRVRMAAASTPDAGRASNRADCSRGSTLRLTLARGPSHLIDGRDYLASRKGIAMRRLRAMLDTITERALFASRHRPQVRAIAGYGRLHQDRCRVVLVALDRRDRPSCVWRFGGSSIVAAARSSRGPMRAAFVEAAEVVRSASVDVSESPLPPIRLVLESGCEEGQFAADLTSPPQCVAYQCVAVAATAEVLLCQEILELSDVIHAIDVEIRVAAISSPSKTASRVSSGPRAYNAVRSASWLSSSFGRVGQRVPPIANDRRPQHVERYLLHLVRSRCHVGPRIGHRHDGLVPVSRKHEVSARRLAQRIVVDRHVAMPNTRPTQHPDAAASTFAASTAEVTLIRLWYRESGNSVCSNATLHERSTTSVACALANRSSNADVRSKLETTTGQNYVSPAVRLRPQFAPSPSPNAAAVLQDFWRAGPG